MERNEGYISEHIEYYWILGEKYFSTKTGQRTMMKFLNHKKFYSIYQKFKSLFNLKILENMIFHLCSTIKYFEMKYLDK